MKNTELWKKICEFKLDDPDAEIKFSDKLCKEESWSKTLATLVISEYKKFVYLCITQPNGASPSEEIDKVWHLHLTYTDNYWNEFCKKTLGVELHHYPSKGGKSENTRHIKWYDETIVAYIKEFGEIPPASIWPLPKSFDLEKHLPQNSPFRTPVYEAIGTPFDLPFVNRILLGCGLCFAILLFFTKNPFQLSGFAFLGFYAILMLIGFVIAYSNKLFKEMSTINIVSQLHPLHISAVFKGLETTMRMLTVNFVEKGYLSYNGEEFEHRFDKNEPLFYSIQAHENEKIGIKSVRLILLNHADYFVKLTQPLKEAIKSKGHYFLVFHFIIVLMGVIRIIQGFGNKKPVGFLVVMVILYIPIAYFLNEFSISSKDNIKSTVEENSDSFNFAPLAGAYLFTNFYLLNDENGINTTFDPHYVETGRYTGNSGGASSCSGGDGGGGGDGCGGGCGGCGGGD
ncbi:glycine-rich domain-containing protein [Emticicia fontis]